MGMRSIISLSFPEYFLVAMPIRLIVNVGKGPVLRQRRREERKKKRKRRRRDVTSQTRQKQIWCAKKRLVRKWEAFVSRS